MKPKVSIVIVHYHCINELIDCLRSIQQTTPSHLYEIIVVDNDEEKTLPQRLKKERISLKYIPNDDKGFGEGCNVGARHANAEYIFFLNPDTIVYKGCIQKLTSFIDAHDNYTVAPVLLSPKGYLYPLQGTSVLTPIKAIFSISFISKIWPNNPIAKTYWNRIKKGTSVYKVDILPGTAFMMRKKIFKKLNGFDENFFLYFEENDLFCRALAIGQQQAILSDARIIHLWGISTQNSSGSFSYFLKSRFYYLKKWYGIIPALLTEGILRLGWAEAVLTLLIAVGGFLRLMHPELTPFGGDQGWFYLSARDGLLTHTLPLAGVTSSHTWLTQGPLWTYLVMICFAFTKFNPITPVIVTAILNIVSLVALYVLARKFFDKPSSLVTTAIATFSPLFLIHSRTAYHTSLIFPATMLLLWSMYKLRSTSGWYLPLVLFSLGVLYNLEIATISLAIATGTFFMLDKQTRHQMYRIWNKKLLFISLIGLLVPMLPFLALNIQSRFHQLFMISAWVGYKIIFFIPHLFTGGLISDPSLPFGYYSAMYIRRLLFLPNESVALLLFFLLHLVFFVSLFITWRKKQWGSTETFLASFYLVPLGVYCLQHIPSEGYIPMLFAGFALMCGYVFATISKQWKLLFFGVLLVVMTINLYTFFSQNFLMTPQDYSYSLYYREAIIQKALVQTKGNSVQIVFHGPLDIFPSNRMNYEYLAWYLGAKIDHTHPDKTITVTDTGKALTTQVQ